MNWHALLDEAIETTGKYQSVAPDVFAGLQKHQVRRSDICQ